MRSCGQINFRKQKEIKNDEQCIFLEISLEPGCLEKRKVTSSGPRGSVGRPGKGMTTSMTISTINRSKINQKANVATTDVYLQS